MELYFGATRRIATQFLAWGGGPTIGIMEGCGNRVSCRNLFKKLLILSLTSKYL